MKSIKELGLEVIVLQDQTILVDKNLRVSIGWAYNKIDGVWWISSSDRYDYGIEVIASTKYLRELPILKIINKFLPEKELWIEVKPNVVFLSKNNKTQIKWIPKTTKDNKINGKWK